MAQTLTPKQWEFMEHALTVSGVFVQGPTYRTATALAAKGYGHIAHLTKNRGWFIADAAKGLE